MLSADSWWLHTGPCQREGSGEGSGEGSPMVLPGFPSPINPGYQSRHASLRKAWPGSTHRRRDLVPSILRLTRATQLVDVAITSAMLNVRCME